MNSERANLLRRCREEGKWRDGLALFVYPMRISLYRFTQRVRRGGSPQAEKAIGMCRTPRFNEEASPVVAPRSLERDGVEGVEALFAEVDRQSEGIFRLAGGRDGRVDHSTGNDWDDPEDRHAYHRLYWAARYAQAAAFGHSAAVKSFERDWNVWRNERRLRNPLAQSAYTTSERIASLAEVIYWLPAPANARFATTLKRQVWEDATQLAANVEYALGMHNHLLNNARALYIASAVVPGTAEAELWRRRAFEIWDEYFPALVLDDGTFAEQSSHYHLLLCRTLLEYLLACRVCGHAAPDGFEESARAMFRLANDLLRADGTLPRFGDNSPDHPVEDLWGLVAAAFHHGLLDETPHHRAITPLTIYYCGTAPRLPQPAATAPTMKLYPNGGFAFLRAPRHAAELVVHADPRPEIRAHGDAGQGSFEVRYEGEVVIREPGSFLRFRDRKSVWSRSAAAQNVTCLNGLAGVVSLPEDASLAPWYWPQSNSEIGLQENGLRFRSHGFQRLQCDLTLERVWYFDEDFRLVLEERIAGVARSWFQFESHLCLGDGELSAMRRDGDLVIFDLTGRRASVRMRIEVPSEVCASIQAGSVIPEYGVEKAARVLLLHGRVRPPVRWRLRIECHAAMMTQSTSFADACV